VSDVLFQSDDEEKKNCERWLFAFSEISCEFQQIVRTVRY
jgi:hypothetical protein